MKEAKERKAKWSQDPKELEVGIVQGPDNPLRLPGPARVAKKVPERLIPLGPKPLFRSLPHPVEEP